MNFKMPFLHGTFGTATVVALISAFGTASCTREPLSAQHTVAEYRSNADLRREQFARCTNDPGTLGKTPDCVNAREAQRLEDMRSVRDLPPVWLPPPPSK
jgi:hypothetical protein